MRKQYPTLPHQTTDFQAGFTFIEAILYVAIISIMMMTLIPFAWNAIGIGAQSNVQQEVSGNARLISERIKYEIRNSTGINSVSSSSISLIKPTAALNPTIITWTAPNITIKQGAGATTQLNSNDVNLSSFAFTNNTEAVSDPLTVNITFVFTIQQAYTGPRSDYSSSATYRSSVEVRGN